VCAGVACQTGTVMRKWSKVVAARASSGSRPRRPSRQESGCRKGGAARLGQEGICGRRPFASCGESPVTSQLIDNQVVKVSARISACAAFAALVLCGCVTSAQRPTAQIQTDRFSPVITVIGPADDVNPYGGTYRRWFLRSFVNKKTHTVATQLYVEANYVGGRRSYSIAADDTGGYLSVDQIASDVDICFGRGVCSLDETVAIQVDDAKLESHAQQGYAVRLSAKSGESFIITIEPEQIQAQLSALERFGRLSSVMSPGRRALTCEAAESRRECQ
jgi:hypothetical protein